ncbi:MAG: PH domain-containing protein [Deltaproteobacteria bacterium]|nr:PH domain-containing protein [Deltaproteobacteria bacterium]
MATPPPTEVAAGAQAPVGPATVIFEGSPSWKASFWSYVFAVILSLVLIGLVWLLVLHLKRKNTRYKITDRSIDYEIGIFTRRIETLPLWRVRDISFQQGVMERMMGVARIRILTTDTTDHELTLRGLPGSRELFDKVKEAAEVSRQQRVMGVVE